MNCKTSAPRGITGDSGTPTILWNGMIAPIVPYAIRGVVTVPGQIQRQPRQQYRTLFPAMIADWRRAWGRTSRFCSSRIAPHTT
jgi:sialate O-acetylesterase